MISLSLKSFPVSSGQNADGMVPFGLNMTTSRWRGRAGAARPRLGSPTMNGSEAAERPNCLMNCRRWVAFMTIFRRLRVWNVQDLECGGLVRLCKRALLLPAAFFPSSPGAVLT